jgi:predicted TIM-barrel fold metal-dependent hydrolase
MILNRRSVIVGAGMALVAGKVGAQGVAVPFSKGTGLPTFKLPPNAVDCHMHFYHSRFPMTANVVNRSPDATPEQYKLLQQRLGMSRVVVVTPSAYGADNSATLDGMSAFGDKARGVAVVTTDVTDAELKRLHGLGIRGIRFNLATAGTTTIEMVEPLAKRIAELGWHAQFHMRNNQIAEAESRFRDLPIQIIFDHLGRAPQPGATDHASYKAVRSLIDRGRAWVKLSGFYFETKVDEPSYADTAEVAHSYFRAAPERVVWGSDWPHVTEPADKKPDDAIMLDVFEAWGLTEAQKRQIFVSNPEKFYDFPKMS